MSSLTKLYGRRIGRPLRAAQQHRIDEQLNQFKITLPVEGQLNMPSSPAQYLEIGFGGGEHLAGQAEQNPDINFIGCEAFINGIVTLIQHIQDKNLTNVRIHPDDARQLIDKLPDASIDRLFILFPDPWPKKKHHKRRLVSLGIMQDLSRIMKPGAELRIATDDDSYAEWIEEVLTKQTFFDGPLGDIHQPPKDWVPTRYQARAQRLGNICRFYRLVRI